MSAYLIPRRHRIETLRAIPQIYYKTTQQLRPSSPRRFSASFSILQRVSVSPILFSWPRFLAIQPRVGQLRWMPVIICARSAIFPSLLFFVAGRLVLRTYVRLSIFPYASQPTVFSSRRIPGHARAQTGGRKTHESRGRC